MSLDERSLSEARAFVNAYLDEHPSEAMAVAAFLQARDAAPSEPRFLSDAPLGEDAQLSDEDEGILRARLAASLKGDVLRVDDARNVTVLGIKRSGVEEGGAGP